MITRVRLLVCSFVTRVVISSNGRVNANTHCRCRRDSTRQLFRVAAEDATSVAPSGAESGRILLALFGVSREEFVSRR